MNRKTTQPLRHHLDRRADALAERFTGGADDLLSTTALAEMLDVSTQFLEIARHRGLGPQFVRISPRRIRYRRRDVLKWLVERRHSATGEYDTGLTGRRRVT